MHASPVLCILLQQKKTALSMKKISRETNNWILTIGISTKSKKYKKLKNFIFSGIKIPLEVYRPLFSINIKNSVLHLKTIQQEK